MKNARYLGLEQTRNDASRERAAPRLEGGAASRQPTAPASLLRVRGRPWLGSPAGLAERRRVSHRQTKRAIRGRRGSRVRSGEVERDSRTALFVRRPPQIPVNHFE